MLPSTTNKSWRKKLNIWQKPFFSILVITWWPLSFILLLYRGSIIHTICTFLGLLIKTKNNTSSCFMLPSVFFVSSFLTHWLSGESQRQVTEWNAPLPWTETAGLSEFEQSWKHLQDEIEQKHVTKIQPHLDIVAQNKRTCYIFKQKPVNE